MQLHLVGGFLGSGKTTAIIHAAKELIAQGKRVGVVTNDQGKYLVDTAFFRLSDIPTVEVTGGCFCCNYDDLDERLEQLQNEIQPDVIFAESVGSCGDLVSTVIKPLLTLGEAGAKPTSFSVFADSRILQIRLSGEELPYSENVAYIFDKQIEEAPILVINKVDLIETEEAHALAGMARSAYPSKVVLLQNSLEPEHVHRWVHLISQNGIVADQGLFEIDYQRYGSGEAQLSWLDLQYQFQTSRGDGRIFLLDLMGGLLAEIRTHQIPIGHVKFLIQCENIESKISFTMVDEEDWQKNVPTISEKVFDLLINARVEMPSQALYHLVRAVTERCAQQNNVEVTVISSEYFHPGFPTPTHRM
jgi:Ni2+-binding GTPase involved in maturation of urease and hydrogenase